ncbi:MAG: DEAD/DEAH box helicase family protein [Planctomycetaceae bacterium]
MQLRPYQEAARAAVYDHLRDRDDNPCVVIPTGGGKTPLMAAICHDAVTLWSGRVLILAHVKELLEQTAEKLEAVSPDLPFGIHSAGLGRRDTREPVIVAGIQSIWKRACDLDPFDLVIVDESHMIPPDGEGMYRRFLADAQVVNPDVRVIGLTATPFRMKSGMICTPDGILNHVCYEVGVRELIRDGYLCPLVTKAGHALADTSGLHVRGGEFVAGEVEDLMDTEELVEAACAEIVARTADRRAVLIFASGVRHGRHVQQVLRDRHGVECGFVCAETPKAEREEIIGRYRRGELRFLANVNVLTTGFDAPHVDCVAMLRPTLSPGLYYQMVGRGFRPDPRKRNCLVLDFGGNVLQHGPVDRIEVRTNAGNGNGQAPAKQCPECDSVIAAGYAVCPDCGYEFPPPDRRKHEPKATEAGILSGQVTDAEYDVLDVTYSVHAKRNAPPDSPRSMRVDYRLGLSHWQSEWICFEHTGFAREKAEQWWRRRSPDPIPATAERAVELANAGALAMTEAIVIRSVAGEKYDSIVGHRLGSLPEPVEAEVLEFFEEQPPVPIPAGGIDLDDVPF